MPDDLSEHVRRQQDCTHETVQAVNPAGIPTDGPAYSYRCADCGATESVDELRVRDPGFFGLFDG